MIETIYKALEELTRCAINVKASLDGPPNGEPVCPQSAALTWPISTALLALKEKPE